MGEMHSEKKRPEEDFVVCTSAVPDKLTTSFEFQSLKDPNRFYSTKRDILTKRAIKACFQPDHPRVLIVRFFPNGKIQDIDYGYRDVEAFEKEDKRIDFRTPVISYLGQLMLWVFGPVLFAALFILVLYFSGYLDLLRAKESQYAVKETVNYLFSLLPFLR